MIRVFLRVPGTCQRFLGFTDRSQQATCLPMQLVLAVEEVADELLAKVMAGVKKLTVGRWETVRTPMALAPIWAAPAAHAVACHPWSISAPPLQTCLPTFSLTQAHPRCLHSLLYCVQPILLPACTPFPPSDTAHEFCTIPAN